MAPSNSSVEAGSAISAMILSAQAKKKTNLGEPERDESLDFEDQKQDLSIAKKPVREESEAQMDLDSDSSAMNGSSISQMMAKN